MPELYSFFFVTLQRNFLKEVQIPMTTNITPTLMKVTTKFKITITLKRAMDFGIASVPSYLAIT